MNTKSIIITIVLILGISLPLNAKPLTLDEVLEGSCRISVSNGIGSGTCIAKDKEYYIFLTNGHVVENAKTAYVELFRRGYKSYKIPATVLKTFWQDGTDKDFSLLGVDEKYVSQCPPRIIPLVPLGYDIPVGYVCAAGCPEGKWLCGWEGRIEEKKGTRLVFAPPPVGGQSGSGLLVNWKDANGELHTRVGAVITFRIGDEGIFSDRRDANGFELAKGAALPITTLYKLLGYDKTTYRPTVLPLNYITTQSTDICPHCQKKHTNNPNDYAIGNNNKGYCVRTTNQQVTLRDDNGTYTVDDLAKQGILIARWPNGGRIIPIPKPSTPPSNGNPFGDNLPNILPDLSPPNMPLPSPPDIPSPEILPGPTPQDEEIENLKDQIQDLQNKITDYDKILLDKQQLEQELNKKQNELTQKQEELHIEKQQSISLTDLLKAKNGETEILSSQIDTITSTVTTLENDKESLAKQAESVTEEAETLKTQRNWISGIGGTLLTGLLSTLGWMYWKNRGKVKINQAIDSVQDRVDDRLDNVIGEDLVAQLRGVVDNLQNTASNAVDNAIKSQLPPLIKNIVEKKTSEPAIYKNEDKNVEEDEDNNSENTVDKPGSRRYNRRRRRKTQPNPVVSEPVSFNITNTNTNTNTDKEDYVPNYLYIKEFFKHKEQDGEDIKDWALLGILYKEAVTELKKGTLYYKGKTRLQGQQNTARQINEWVRKEFLQRMTRRDIFNQDELYKEAMLGFLYKEAVDKLAAGDFSVLGYQATATAIHDWVNAEFLKRINVNI